MIRSSRVMPALLTRMSILPEGLEDRLDQRLGGLGVAGVHLDGEAAPAERLDLGDRRVGGGLVAAEAERDVGALAREAEHDRPPDAARAAGDERGLAREVDHPCSSCQRTGCGAGSGSPGTTSSSGTSMPGRDRPAHDLGERGRDRVDGVPVDGHADRHVLGADGRVADEPAGRVGGPLHRDGPGREPGAERDHHELVADLDAALVDGLGERDRHRRGRRVPVPVEVDEHPLHRQVEALGHRLDDPDVGLVRDEQVDVARRRCPPCRRPPAPSRRASGSRTGRSPCPPCGSCARRGRSSRPTAGSSTRPPGSQIMYAPCGSVVSSMPTGAVGSSDADSTTAPAPSPNRMQVLRSV